MIDNKLYIEPKIDESVFKKFQKLDLERKNEKIREIPVIEAKNVVKKYNNNTVIPNLSFKIEDIEGKNEIIAMLGPSGCGKSTILKLIAGLIMPTSGELYCYGKKIEGPGLERGMIFQKYTSFPFLNVLDNIAYPLIHVKKMKKSDAYEQAKYWIDKMYLTGAEYKYPHQLSGGMQQRVAIARTLCMKAKIILMDEPFGALDRKIRWEMQDLMAEILFINANKNEEITVILVTHDIPEAVYLGDRIWIVNKGNIVETKYLDRPTEPARIAQSRKEFQELVSYFNKRIDELEIK